MSEPENKPKEPDFWNYANTLAWALVGALLAYVFVPSRELTSWINALGFFIFLGNVIRLAYLWGKYRKKFPAL